MTGSSLKELSGELRQYIEALVEEVVLEGKPFEQKYLRRLLSAEGLDYVRVEENLADFFDVISEYKRSKTKSGERLARLLAKDCYLSDEVLARLMGDSTLQTTEFVDPKILIRDGRMEELENDGRLIIPCSWDEVADFHEGKARVVSKNGLTGFIDSTGDVVIPCRWKKATDFSEGLAVVGDEKGDFFFIDKAGDIVITCGTGVNPFQLCSGFHEGLAAVEFNGKYGFIDKTGRVAISYIWEYAGCFEDGLASVQDGSGKFGCIDKAGRLVVSCFYDDEILFYEGWAFIYQEWKEGPSYFIDRTGRKVLETNYATYSGFKEGLASMEDVGFIDKTGRLVIEDKWSPERLGFSEGLAPTEYGYIDHSGRIVIQNDWDECMEFHEGLAMVNKDGKSGFIDHSGGMVSPCMWDYADDFSEGLAVVSLAGKEYFINKQGKVLCKVK